MIKHIVLFKLRDNSPEACAKARDTLLSMEGKVPMLRGLHAGVDRLHSARSYDVVVEVLLDDMDALDAYQNDPYHCDVVKDYMHRVVETSVSMDYEYPVVSTNG
ncbi:MAG: Dabb family protein [Clostridia bacterium]|nr:Dabb family protein [Clostridia bacterium]